MTATNVAMERTREELLRLFNEHESYALMLARILYAKRTTRRQMSFEEIHAAALEGLWDACRRWDGRRRFTTYAQWRIQGAIGDYLRATRPLGLRARLPRLMAKVSLKQLSAFRNSDKDDAPFACPVAAEDARLARLSEHVDHLLARVPPKARWLLRAYYLRGRKLRQIAADLGLHETTMSLRLAKALKMLRAAAKHEEDAAL